MYIYIHTYIFIYTYIDIDINTHMYLYILVFILIHGYTYAHIHRYRPTIDRFEIDSLLGNHPTPIHAPASQWAGRECAGTETLSVCHKLHPALDSASIPCQHSPRAGCRYEKHGDTCDARGTPHQLPSTCMQQQAVGANRSQPPMHAVGANRSQPPTSFPSICTVFGVGFIALFAESRAQAAH